MINNSNFIRVFITFLFLVLLCVPAYSDKAADKKAEILEMEVDTLTNLYHREPNAKKNVQNAAGYAVFSNFGMKIFLAGGGKGSGVAVNNKTKKKTFMKMAELQAGLGIGIKKFKQVWVFENASALNSFINSGWELSGQGTAAAQLNDQGAAFAGAMSVEPGVWLYQITEDGLALELTGKGTKYYKDGDLN
ncbi:MAG: YSC84-related protein [Thermodesulfobacteriota bacterium]